MDYPVESFTAAECERLAPHFTNLDRPVFALVNLPETVKGAMFARYSRYQGTLRRLFLDEFAADLPEGAKGWDGEEGERAAGLYERVFVGYGDDSVAQLGGAHMACEWVSNVLTKVLQRPRLGAYLEQPRATSPTTRRSAAAAATATTATRSWGPSTKRPWTTCSRPTRTHSPPSEEWAADASPARTASRRPPTRAP